MLRAGARVAFTLRGGRACWGLGTGTGHGGDRLAPLGVWASAEAGWGVAGFGAWWRGSGRATGGVPEADPPLLGLQAQELAGLAPVGQAPQHLEGEGGGGHYPGADGVEVEDLLPAATHGEVDAGPPEGQGVDLHIRHLGKGVAGWGGGNEMDIQKIRKSKKNDILEQHICNICCNIYLQHMQHTRAHVPSKRAHVVCCKYVAICCSYMLYFFLLIF